MIKDILDIDNVIKVLVNRRRGLILGELGMSADTLDGTVLKELRSSKRDIKRLSKSLQEKEAEISSKDAEIARLEKEVEKYKRLAGRLELPVANTRNSSIPSSKNPLGAPKQTRSLRKSSGKKTGGQPGHEGKTRQYSDDVDNRIVCAAPSVCPKCGQTIDASSLKILERRQMIDIPAVIVPLVTEFALQGGTCECGCCVKGEYPKEATAPVCYGYGIQATIAYLSAQQCIPFKRITELMKNLFGVDMSQGTVSNILNNMRKKAAVPYEKIRQVVSKSKVVGADETGIDVNGESNWLWTFQTDMATYLAADKSRGKKVIEQHFPDGFSKSTLVTDRLRAYFNLEVKDHQVCLAHLLRNTTYIEELLGKESDWGTRMLKTLRESIHARKTKETDEATKQEYIEKLEALLGEEIRIKSDKKQKVFDTFRKGLEMHKEHMFTFLAKREVPYDNNTSEQSLRMAKTKMKVSGQFKSDDGAANYATLQSIIQTAKKNGKNPYEALVAIAQYEYEP